MKERPQKWIGMVTRENGNTWKLHSASSFSTIIVSPVRHTTRFLEGVFRGFKFYDKKNDTKKKKLEHVSLFDKFS